MILYREDKPLRLLIAVKSCDGATRFGANKLIHDTWGREIRDADVRFFCGRGSAFYHQDEIVLPCPDDYEGLPAKTKAILKWALKREYDFIFLCDTDTCIAPGRIFTSCFHEYDIMGRLDERTPDQNDVMDQVLFWPSGGAGYWLSARAAHTIIQSDVEDEAEDRMVGRALWPDLASGAMRFKSHELYGPDEGTANWERAITRHYSPRTRGGEYDPTWMAKQYEVLRGYQ